MMCVTSCSGVPCSNTQQSPTRSELGSDGQRIRGSGSLREPPQPSLACCWRWQTRCVAGGGKRVVTTQWSILRLGQALLSTLCALLLTAAVWWCEFARILLLRRAICDKRERRWGGREWGAPGGRGEGARIKRFPSATERVLTDSPTTQGSLLPCLRQELECPGWRLSYFTA